MIILCAMIDDENELSKFQQIYTLYKNTMYSVAYDISKSIHDAEDIVEDSLIKIVENLKDINPEEIDKPRCKNLVITITKNTAIDQLRKKEKLPIPSEYIEEQLMEISTEELYIDMENYQNVIACIDEMDDKYREVIRLKVLHERSSKEIGKILNISEQHVNVRFMRAKEILARKLGERNKDE